MSNTETEVYGNVQSEYLFVGALYKDPDQYLLFGNSIRSTYDFNDEATRFFYDLFELMYATFTKDITERSVNTFATMDPTRFSTYTKYQGFRTIKAYMDAANLDDVKNYYNTLKKYSLLREYQRKGFPVDWIVNRRDFQLLTAEEIVQLVAASINKVSTVILCEKEAEVVNSGVKDAIGSYLITPQMGICTPWEGYNSLFRGCRLEKAIFDGALSNEGKTRKLMQLAAHIALIEEEPFLLMSNEMSIEDLRSCLITTVINNKEYQQYHGVELDKKEYEIVMGQYRDDATGQFMEQYEDESDEDYLKRMTENSTEFRKIQQIADWIDKKRERNLYFKDMGSDYSDRTLEITIKKYKELYGIQYFGYDTLKGYRTDDWQSVKQTATMLKELMKNEKLFMYAVFQLTDDTVYCQIQDLTSNNIANAKQIKHIADHLTLNMKIHPADYDKYEYIPFDSSIAGITKQSLDKNKVYYGTKIDKNRAADKSKMLLFEVNLDYNTWDNIGYLYQKEITKPQQADKRNRR